MKNFVAIKPPNKRVFFSQFQFTEFFKIENYRIFIIVLLLGIFFIQGLYSMKEMSLTSDEICHLPAGYTYLKSGDYRMNPEHPPFMKLLAGIPLLFLELDDFTNYPSWQEGKNDILSFGSQFIYNNKVAAKKIIFWGRLPMLLFGTLFGLILYLITRQLCGNGAALGALFFYAFCPNFLAHTWIVHTDVGAAAFTMLSLYCFYRLLHQPMLVWGVLWGLSFGLGFASKFSLVLLPVMFFIQGMIYLYQHKILKIKYTKRESQSRIVTKLNISVSAFIKFGLVIILGLIVGYVVLIACYGFSFWLPEKLVEGWESIQYHSELGHQCYLMGHYSMKGWLSYFPIAFLLKTPIPTLLLLGWGLLHFKFTHSKKNLYFLLPIAFFFLFFCLRGVNIGIRHILPIYPVIFLINGRTLSYMKGKWFKGVLLGWYALGSLLAFPNYIPYFNEIIGGAARGHRYLSDSNLTWGQDYNKLLNLVDKQEKEKTYVTPFFNHSVQDSLISEKIESIPEIAQWVSTSGFYAVDLFELQNVWFLDRRRYFWLKLLPPNQIIGHSIWIWDISLGNQSPKEYLKTHLQQTTEKDLEFLEMKPFLSKPELLFQIPIAEGCLDKSYKEHLKYFTGAPPIKAVEIISYLEHGWQIPDDTPVANFYLQFTDGSLFNETLLVGHHTQDPVPLNTKSSNQKRNLEPWFESYSLNSNKNKNYPVGYRALLTIEKNLPPNGVYLKLNQAMQAYPEAKLRIVKLNLCY